MRIIDDIFSNSQIPSIKAGETHIYTDASMDGNGSGLAALNYENRKFVLESSKWTNPFELESTAILLALRHLDRLVDNTIKLPHIPLQPRDQART